jgi:hypothetical protein
MRASLALLILGLLLIAGCTTAPRKEQPKVLCPACGSELDAVIHKHF